jgi:hypothetical protein
MPKTGAQLCCTSYRLSISATAPKAQVTENLAMLRDQYCPCALLLTFFDRHSCTHAVEHAAHSKGGM